MKQQNKHISIVGYAYGGAGNVPGCKDGPAAFRNNGLIDKLKDLGYQVTDRGDAIPDPEVKVREELDVNNLGETFSACKTLYEEVTAALEANSFPLILGGDHSSSIGSVPAVCDFYKDKGPLGLLWVDTHPDINTPLTSPSKNIFGMSVAALLGQIPGTLSSLQKSTPAIAANALVYIGLRDVDCGERELIKRLGIRCYTMKDIDSRGLFAVLNEAIEYLAENSSGFFTSFDLDVCDPRIVSAIGTPCRGGLTYREAHLVMEKIYDSNKCRALEIVELNPSLDNSGESTEIAVSLLESGLGKSIL
jgi:arginase